MKKLQGSEKQVAWAEDLRSAFIEKVEAYKVLEAKESLTTEESNKKSSLETQIFSNLAEAEENIKAELGIDRKTLRQLDRAEAKEKRHAAKAEKLARIAAWKQAEIEEKLAETSASAWIESRPQ